MRLRSASLPVPSAFSSLNSTVSTATILEAAARTAPCTTLRPTPPQPKTATVLPVSTLALLITAPTPVITPQPMRQAFSRGTSFPILTSDPAPTTGLLCECGQPVVVAEAVLAELGARAGSAGCGGVGVTQVGTARGAVTAAAALRGEGEDDVVSGRQVRYAASDLLDPGPSPRAP